MSKVDLARAKLHLRVDADDENALIEAWIVAVYAAIEGKVFRKVYDTPADIPAGDETGIATNEVINSAALLIVGHLYAYRESSVANQAAELPMGVEWLLTPYINTAAGF